MIPLGLPGVAAVLWFWAAGIWVLWRNYKWSSPELKNVNRFLFVSFVSTVIFFCGVYGCFYLDLAVFTGMAGLSVSLNGGVKKGVPAYGTAPATPALVPVMATTGATASQPASA